MIDEGNRPLDGQFCKAASYSTYDDTATQESDGRAKPPSPTAPRVMTNTELLLSIHSKVDQNHKWVKRRFGSIVKTLNGTENAVKKNHYYLHEVFDRTWAIPSHLRTPEELQEMEFTQDFDWSWPPKKKFKNIPVRDLVDNSFSLFCTADLDEEPADTATGTTRKSDSKNARASFSTQK